MNWRERIVEHIRSMIGAGEAREANIVLGLLIGYFAGNIAALLGATSEQLSEFLYARYRAHTTIARRLNTLRLIYSILVEWKIIGENPAIDVERPTIVDKQTDFDVSLEDVERLLAFQESVVHHCELRASATAHRERATLATLQLVAGGALIAELEGLTVRDLSGGCIIVGRHTPRERPIWPSDQALKTIRAAAHSSRPLPPAPEAPLFLIGYGTRPNTKTAWGLLQRAVLRAGLEGRGLTPAKLHRAAAKSLLEKGLGWDAARQPSSYLRIPRTKYVPSLEEMEQTVMRCHPLEIL
ncbi:hypothetical protein WN73_37665 [Bradyrhizobium sp. CCBAU 45394]|uniref:hypothetical protein n=1 Tax=Bradyrhizobium sp. CCBAU 45394 TaxID=1325087 RepID=UPI00230206D6|nr:hypothetical protein [Bradyrhizobium sp. CCBAU 45394]MDA9396249.1 hypothetical protein [Bradyrhizobium sp. CCBAU 45394]